MAFATSTVSSCSNAAYFSDERRIAQFTQRPRRVVADAPLRIPHGPQKLVRRADVLDLAERIRRVHPHVLVVVPQRLDQRRHGSAVLDRPQCLGRFPPHGGVAVFQGRQQQRHRRRRGGASQFDRRLDPDRGHRRTQVRREVALLLGSLALRRYPEPAQEEHK